MKRFTFALFAVLAIGSIAGFTFIRNASADATTKPSAAAPTTEPTKTVANTKCPITKEAVDASVPTTEYKGKTIGFCCSDCVKTFKADPDKYMADLK